MILAKVWLDRESLREQLKDCSAAFDRQQQQLDRNAEQNAAQLDELHRISEALGTNDGHSSVTHIEILKGENAALREQLATISKILHYPGCWDTMAYPDIESCIKEIWAICATCEIKE